jgi:hypothetical protein
MSSESEAIEITEPNNWLTKAGRASRRLVIAAGRSDYDIDRLIKQAQQEVEPLIR